MVGDPALVEPVRDDFIAFVKSVRFTGGGDPNLFPPKGWEPLPGDGTRLVTIRVPSGGHFLELAVSRLPRGNDTLDDYVLVIANRWREEMGLDPIQASELSSQTETMKAGVHDAVLVDIADPDGTKGGFASRAAPPRSTGRGDGTEQVPEFPIAFDAPAEWVAEYIGAYRTTTFTAVYDGAEIVNIEISRGGGDKLLNVFNLWRSHVDLPPWSPDEMAREIKKIETLGTTGDYVQLVGHQQTILGVIVNAGGSQWFIQLWGDPEPAERERERFEAFVKSMKLGA